MVTATEVADACGGEENRGTVPGTRAGWRMTRRDHPEKEAA